MQVLASNPFKANDAVNNGKPGNPLLESNHQISQRRDWTMPCTFWRFLKTCASTMHRFSKAPSHPLSIKMKLNPPLVDVKMRNSLRDLSENIFWFYPTIYNTHYGFEFVRNRVSSGMLSDESITLQKGHEKTSNERIGIKLHGIVLCG